MEKKSNFGFTLVEIIVIILIVAILAAIIIPVTISIIDSSNEVEIAMDAKNIWNGVQSVLTEKMALDDHFISGESNKYGAPINKSDLGITDNNWSNKYKEIFEGKLFADLTSYDFSKTILNKIENVEDIKAIYFGAGHFYYNYVESNDTVNKAYTTCLIVFQYYDDEKVYFYDGKKISEDWPFASPKSVQLLNDNTELKINYESNKNYKVQLYCIKKYNNSKVNDTSKPMTYFKNMFSID